MLFWHMHQPFYKDLVTGEYILPWVRLHATKDYYDMVAILDKFPEVKANFNLVPSLMAQVEDYVKNDVSDRFLTLTRKEPKELREDERVFILQNFFMANPDTMIKPYPRYQDLLLKRGRFASPAELQKVARRFSPQELLDLQVWFNLTWFGFIYKNQDPVIKELIAKGKYFTEEDKRLVLEKQKEIMGLIVPKYRELAERGQIELTTTPYYHPILPLLCNTDIARESWHNLPLPETPFRHPEDADAQIRMAVEFHQNHFGQAPAGMWPSEGSVSEQMVPLAAKNGIKWLATDEGILERSLQRLEMRSRAMTAADLYQPYLMQKDGAEVAMLFRNRFISDQVGFVYYRWRIEDALNDFRKHVNNIKMSLPEDGNNYILPVILDGENAWEYYQGGGKDFLEAFYQMSRSDQNMKTVRVSDYLAENPPRKKLTKLFPGSWINSNYNIWIGHREDNQAWDYLNKTRLALEHAADGDKATAWQEIYIAEGSDWCWWYGDDHSSDNDAVFDALFRKHLKNVYKLINRPAPKYLDVPIKKVGVLRPVKEPTYLVHPVLDGELTNYFEWLAAGYFDFAGAKGAMHQVETVLRGIYYGFSLESFYLRFETTFSLKIEEAKEFSFGCYLATPRNFKLELIYDDVTKKYRFFLYHLDDGHNWEQIKELETFGIRRIVELGVSFADLGVKKGEKVDFQVFVGRGGLEVEKWPRGGTIAFNAPDERYEQEQWIV